MTWLFRNDKLLVKFSVNQTYINAVPNSQHTQAVNNDSKLNFEEIQSFSAGGLKHNFIKYQEPQGVTFSSVISSVSDNIRHFYQENIMCLLPFLRLSWSFGLVNQTRASDHIVNGQKVETETLGRQKK